MYLRPQTSKIILFCIFIVTFFSVFSQNQDINIPESGDFGNVALNVPSVITFTLENKGTGSPSSTLLTISNMSFSGSATFVVSDITIPPDLLLSKGSSVTFKVTFTPTTAGAKSATLTFISDDPDENPYTLNLQGFGDGTLITPLILLDTYPLTVLEPSGLAFNKANNTLFTVSDNTGLVYNISTTGLTLATLNFPWIDPSDLEGVSMYTTNKILIASEGDRKLYEYDYVTNDGTYLSHTMTYNTTDLSATGDNSRIEGVTYDSVNDEIYFLNEKNPGGLIVADGSFNVIIEYPEPLANGFDYSGSHYVEETGFLWLASDQGSTIYKCNTDGTLVQSFPVTTDGGAPIDKLEGIAIDYTNQLLYAVSDGGQELYVFQINDPSFTLGIEDEFISENKIQIYPIPAKNSLNISLKNYEAVEKVTIYSIQGQLVTQFYSIEKELDISSLNSGMYFLEIITEATKYVKTIAVTK